MYWLNNKANSEKVFNMIVLYMVVISIPIIYRKNYISIYNDHVQPNIK